VKQHGTERDNPSCIILLRLVDGRRCSLPINALLNPTTVQTTVQGGLVQMLESTLIDRQPPRIFTTQHKRFTGGSQEVHKSYVVLQGRCQGRYVCWARHHLHLFLSVQGWLAHHRCCPPGTAALLLSHHGSAAARILTGSCHNQHRECSTGGAVMLLVK
jgi:hypothetical protein